MTTGKMLVGVLIHYSLTSLAFAQLQRAQIDPAKVPIPQQHFQPEYTFDAPGDPLRWATQQSGLNASFGSTDELYMRSEAPDLPNESQRWEDTGFGSLSDCGTSTRQISSRSRTHDLRTP